MQSFQYRPALDGLRALAILPVLLYHADATFATGGFLGVDLFFVLSGYLITSLLVIEARREGAIFLRGFWLRRARRLFPALLVTLLLVSLYAASLASSNELARIRADGISTLGYVANWWYIYGGESYFDRFNSPSPLRHPGLSGSRSSGISSGRSCSQCCFVGTMRGSRGSLSAARSGHSFLSS